jgi:serine/threonine-protein kinase
LTTLAEDELSHRYPHLLPDGRSVLFTIKPAGVLRFDDARIGIADLETGEHRVLSERGTFASYLASGHLVVAREGGLLAAPFDLATLRTTGGAVPVLEGLFTNPVTGAALYEGADNGTLIYVEGDYGDGPVALFATERGGKVRRSLAEGHYASFPELSPDGRRLLMHGATANDAVLLLDLDRGVVTRVTDSSSNNILPIWDHDGSHIVYSTDRSGRNEIVSVPVEGGAIETLVAPRDNRMRASSWSPDGSVLAFNVGLGGTRDIWLLDTTSGESRPFLDTQFDEADPTFSPDGRWLTFSSDETGRHEIYASPLPGPGRKIQLSHRGGRLPRWSADGEELFYESGRRLVAAPVTWGEGPRLGEAETIVELQSTLPLGWTVSRDGKTFYVTDMDESVWQAKRIDVLVNWTPVGP